MQVEEVQQERVSDTSVSDSFTDPVTTCKHSVDDALQRNSDLMNIPDSKGKKLEKIEFNVQMNKT